MSALVVLAQLCHRIPLVDVVGDAAPGGVHLAYPAAHVLLAPFTLLADWLNGGSRHEIIGFLLWALLGYALVRLVARGNAGAPPHGGDATRERIWLRESATAALYFLALAGFVAWAAFLPRPIPRLVADDTSVLVFDVHTHTTLSHDGRPGFTARANAAWHARAGFDAAFVTDHNRFGAARQWRTDAPEGAPRLLEGEELSLFGLHLIVLGNRVEIDNRCCNQSWDSTRALVRRLASSPEPAGATPDSRFPIADSRPFLVASLPEYWRNLWGPRLGDLVGDGVEGFELWTTSPRAMEFPPAHRREVIARARLSRLVLFGATDMHGYGNAATVWNVARLAGWRALPDSALTQALLARWRQGRFAANRVVALARWQTDSRAASALAVPVNAWLVLRYASRAHGAALLGWIWAVAVLAARLRRPLR